LLNKQSRLQIFPSILNFFPYVLRTICKWFWNENKKKNENASWMHLQMGIEKKKSLQNS